MRKEFSIGLQQVRYQGVKPFWTLREYQYQQLIINGFVVQREYPGKSRNQHPMARVDIYYDTGKGIGIKKMRGVAPAVWKEASDIQNIEKVIVENQSGLVKIKVQYTYLNMH